MKGREKMSEIFNERVALRMHLESLLKLRHELRSDYVDRDRVLSLEIKEIINKVQAIEHKVEDLNLMKIEKDEMQAEEVAPKEPVTVPEQMKARKERTRINYEEIKERLLELLQETSEPMSLSTIVSELEQRYGIHLSNPYITIKKITKDISGVKETKEGRVLFFAWKND
ncbi:hypothetical protein EDM56_20025 [Brevibacillus fluminis]|uniref:Repressor Rok winged helix domain-containing protein n=1 Tax=Brevibacillus fluminis TaxID=511487 RepID=A0A3M8DC05_9BACL|nr:hypothetical protein [Brevibacillus fluminis]RNB84855.1 hypothetical protein EDM56_20025 [Brevibacillus fluminis]